MSIIDPKRFANLDIDLPDKPAAKAPEPAQEQPVSPEPPTAPAAPSKMAPGMALQTLLGMVTAVAGQNAVRKILGDEVKLPELPDDESLVAMLDREVTDALEPAYLEPYYLTGDDLEPEGPVDPPTYEDVIGPTASDITVVLEALYPDERETFLSMLRDCRDEDTVYQLYVYAMGREKDDFAGWESATREASNRWFETRGIDPGRRGSAQQQAEEDRRRKKAPKKPAQRLPAKQPSRRVNFYDPDWMRGNQALPLAEPEPVYGPPKPTLEEEIDAIYRDLCELAARDGNYPREMRLTGDAVVVYCAGKDYGPHIYAGSLKIHGRKG